VCITCHQKLPHLIGYPVDNALTHIFRALRFGIVGTITAGCYFLLMFILVDVLHVQVMLATAVVYIVVAIGNYLSHHKWTFKSTERHGVAFPRFIASGVIGFSLNWGVMYFGVQKMQIYYLLVQAVAIVAIVLWNFIVGSLWVFAKSSGESHDANQAETRL
jgi:putative flippase GtrA